MTGDLHLHSHHSDGLLDPATIVERAASLGLGGIALTDHDSIGGWETMEVCCREAGMHWVPGIELSTQHDGQEIHLLGYFPQLNHLRLLPDHLEGLQQSRRNRTRQMITKLSEQGIGWDADQVIEGITCRSPGRPHVARALVAHGKASNVGQAFKRFLRKGGVGWVPSSYPKTVEMIRLVHQDHGLAVLAHPGLGIPNQVVVQLASQGLDGVEVFHSAHKPSLVKKYLYLAKKHGLIVTGGSDCHGPTAGGMRMGKTRLDAVYMDHFLNRISQIEHRQTSRS